ncbi:hypothetical protein [Lachnoclostridium edouardi]|uniref:hypothetical protein n=1 Tax=Lachnoclostridium edouardi TaxID=1926283 RepID=UPI000C7CA922|nr:hypothetical protein [Lachnoclostridium edouardi]MDO4279387.1 hypothetical protein [Lachnoclostridium edouardi]
MPFGEIGAVLLFLAAVFVFGNLWFHFVETILHWIKKPFMRRRKPSSWHTFLPDKEDKADSKKSK